MMPFEAMRFRSGSGSPPPSDPLYDAIMADSPAFYFRLNETSGTSANNETGGADGTYGSSVTLNQAALYSGGPASTLFANNSNSYMRIPSTLVASGTAAAFSLVTIIKPSAVSGIRSIISRDHNAGERIFQWRLNGSSLQFLKIVGGVQTHSVSSVMSAGETAMIHVTVSAAGQVNMYKNGSVLGSPSSFSAANYGGSNTLPVGYDGGVAAGFDGNQSEVAGFKFELTAARCLAHAQAAGF